MAGAVCLRTFLHVVLVLVCAGQYNYYNYYSYGDYGDYDYGWCPFGINGNCRCEEGTVDCTGQGLPSFPLGLPSYINALILKDNQISSVEASHLSSLPSLEVLDLSSNYLQSLPTDIFDSLPFLQEINLSNNPWNCDCSLTWLRIWLQEAEASGIQVLDRSTTTCTEWPTVSMLDILPADLLRCAAPARAVRSLSSVPPPSHVDSNWSQACLYWFTSEQCSKGPHQAGSCVYSPDSRSVAVVTYSNFTKHQDAVTCRNFCFITSYKYYAFQNSTQSCLCGQEDAAVPCTDCVSANISSAALTLCGGTYMRVPSALHVLADVTISFSSPAVVQTKLTFTLAGYPSIVTSLTWNYGDGTVTSATSHTYFYPGLFPVSVELCAESVCAEVKVKVKVKDVGMETELQCPGVSEASSKIGVNFTLSHTHSSEVKWSRTSSDGATRSVGNCEDDWVLFSGKCVKLVTRDKTYRQAQSYCQKEGNDLVALNFMQQVTDLPGALGLGTSDEAYIGALYDGSQYHWIDNTAATFLQALNIDHTAGNCLVITAAGLVAKNCAGRHHFICQKDPPVCPVGHQLGSKDHCFFYNSSSSLTWSMARQECQSRFGGDLAVLDTLSLTSSLVSSVTFSSPAWIGLAAPDLLGHYVWVDGETVTWTNWDTSSSISTWQASGVQWPCVALSSSQHWQRIDCDTDLPFICEYTLNNKTETAVHVAGTADLKYSGNSVTTLNEDSSTLPSQPGLSIVLPGLWFASVGRVSEVILHMEAHSSRTFLTLQVLRPTCPAGQAVIRPGCDNNMFAKCGAPSDASSCATLPPCPTSQYPCLLTDACADLSSPCSCAGMSPAGAFCTNTDPDPNLTYTLIDQLQLQIPSSGDSGSLVSLHVSRVIDVQVGDVVGFQSSGSNLGFCQDDASSPWRQVAFQHAGSSWLSAGHEISLSSDTKLERQVCLFSIVVTNPVTLSLPDSLAYVPEPGSYVFTAEVVGFTAATDSCTIDTVQDVGEITWVHPALTKDTPTSFITVEAGTSEDLVAMVTSGSDLTVVWSLGSGASSPLALSADCPSSVTGVAQCQSPSSQLGHPFLAFQHTFPSSSSTPVTLTLNASNSLGVRSLTIQVFSVVRIQDLVLYHDSCADHLACLPTLEVGSAQQFFTQVSAGDVDTYQYRVNGTGQSPSQASTLSHTFSSPGVYLITVNASNKLGSVQAELYVHAKVRANVQQQSLQPLSPVYAEVGGAVMLNVSADISPQAELTVVWNFGDGTSNTSTAVYTSSSLALWVSHVYTATGTYAVHVNLTDSFGVTVSLHGQVVVQTAITHLTVSASPALVAAGNQTTISVQVHSSSTLRQQFGNITYTYSFDDQSTDVHTSKHTSQTVHHTFSTNSTYNVSVEAANRISSVTDYVNVTVQSCPTKLRLRYNGPKNISEQLNFTADVTGGSDLTYEFDFGDGTTLISWSQPFISYKYSNASWYNASVSVTNSVCSLIDYYHVIVMDANTLVLRKIIHDSHAPVNTYVKFEADVVTLDITKVEFTWTVGALTLTFAGTPIANFSFPTAGVNVVHVMAVLDKRITRNTTTTTISQQPVGPVTMQAPDLISFGSGGPATEWFSATAASGSDVNFRWAMNNTDIISTGPNISQQMGTAGIFNISVIGYNEVSEQGNWSIVVVQHVVENITITCKNCINDRFILKGANDWELHCTYLGTDAVTTWKVGVHTEKTEPVFQHHTFQGVGVQEVRLNVSNKVSWGNATFVMYVEDPVSAVILTAIKSVTKEGSTVELTATPSQGTDVEYVWQCGVFGNVTHVTTQSNTYQHHFPQWGLYTCNVTVQNNVSSQGAHVTIMVLQTITTLQIKDHEPGQTLYVPIDKLPSIQLSCNTNFSVFYTWDVMKDQGSLGKFVGGELRYTFRSVGSYELNITATNTISSKTITVHVEAMEEVTNLSLTTTATAVKLGSNVQLTAHITNGTSVKYEWYVDGFHMAYSNGSVFSPILNKPQQYVVVVNVSNPLNVETTNTTILVQRPVANLQIESRFNFSHPYIAQNQQYTFIGNLSQGSDPEFKWTVLSPPTHAPSEVLGTVLQPSFSELGMYTVILNVSNAVSQVSENFTVYVEKEILLLNLTVTPVIAATNSNVYFDATVNTGASPVIYEWTVEEHMITEVTFMHSFHSASVYLIKAVAYNNISSQEKTTTVKVQDAVSSLQVLDCSKVRTSGLSSLLQATAQGTHISYSWLIQSSTRNRSTSGSSINLTFPSAGFYTLTVWAENEVNKQNASCLLHVQDVIDNVAVAVVNPPADYIFTNQNVTFLIKGDNLQDADYTWNFIGHSTATTNGSTFTTSFPAAQNITLVVLVRNAVSNMSDTLTFTVQELECNLPSVSPVGTASRTVLRSQSVQFDVYINNRGCTKYLALHTWRVFDIPDCTHSLPSSSLNLNAVDMAKPTLILPASSLPASKSQFCVRYTMGYQNTPVAEEVMYNLTALASPLKAIIAGGNQRMVDGTLGSHTLDASFSYNPDNPDTVPVGMNYSWECHLVNSSRSCFIPVTNSTESVLTVSLFMNGSYSCNLSLTVSMSGHAFDTTYQIVDVVDRSPPVLSVGVECVSCLATKQYGISSSHHTALSAHCYTCTCPLQYEWSVTEDQNTTPISLAIDDTSTGTSAANLVVLRNTALKDNLTYKFTVTATCQDGSGSSGNASITLLPNRPPSNGSCTVTPTTITPLTDTVTVTCIGWLDVDSTSAEAALLYEVKAERDGQSYLLYYGTRQTQTMYLAPWPGTGTNATMVVVSVLDEAGARTQALRQPISFTSTSISGNNASQQLLAAAQAMLPTLMQQGDPVPLLQYALALTQLLNSASTTAAGSQATEDLMAQTLVRAAITICVASGVPVSSVQQAQQLAYLLNLLTEFSAEYQTSGSHLLLIQSLQNIVTTMSQSVQPGLDREDFAFRSLLSSAYHLMEAVNLNLVSSTVVTVPMTASALTSSFPDLVHMTQDLSSLLQTLDFTSTITETHKKYVVTEAFDLAEDIIGIVLESLVLDEDAVTFTLGGITIEGTRITVESVRTYVELNGCRFILPPNLFAGLSNSDEILKIVMMLDTNPFTWGYIGQHVITSRVPTLSFKYPDGSDLPISDLSDSIELVMFSSDGNNYTISNGSLIHSQHYDPQANLDLSTWTLGAGEKKKLVIDATNGSSSVAALNIQVRVQALPNATSIIKAYLGAGFEASDSRHTDFKEIKSSDMSAGVDHRQYTFFISDQDFKKDTEYSITLVNQDAKNAVNISAGMYLSSCQFFEESGQAWAASGCSVSDESIPIATACHCNHLTAFGGSSLVPISSIRFTDLASLELGLNPVALATICSILALYIVLVIVCRYLDRADLRRISLVPLCGRDGAYKYHITVTTGRQLGAGTTAHVGIKLYGDNGKSELRHLTKSAAFQRNSCDSFLIATDNELGRLHKLRVWHDNTGPSPCWYLTQVVVRDLQSGQRYVFPASTWLSLQVEDGKLQKEICATDPEELHSFSCVFTASLANGWGERHMWLSVLNRPDHNRFTRVQRVTCCVTLIYLYMFINAMWYGLVKDQADAADSLTWDAFGWEEVIIALVSVVVVFPIALVLICVFKRSRSKPDMFKQALRPQSAQTLEIEAMCDMSQYGGSLRAMTPNDDWMTLFERESTTESIPPISSQLRRTAPVNRSSRDVTSQGSGSSFPGSRGKGSVHCIQRTQNLMWSQENILKSWPEKLPSFAEEEKEKSTSNKPSASSDPTTKSTTANTSNNTSAASAKTSTAATSRSAASTTPKATTAAATKSTTTKTTTAAGAKTATKTTSFTVSTSSPKTGSVKRSQSEPGNQATGDAAGQAAGAAKPLTKPVTAARKTTSFKTETDPDSDDEFRQRLDEIDRELQKASAKTKGSAKSSTASSTPGLKKRSSSSQGAIDDLFDSDDEWTNEGLDSTTKRRPDFNPRQDPHLDRRASLTSLLRLRAASMHVPSSAGGSTRDGSFLRRDSTFMRRDSTLTRHSFMMSEKSRTTLSAMLRNRMQVLDPHAEETGCRLPWFCVYIGYAVCAGLSLISVIMVLLYGYNFGPAIALKWLLSLVLTFLISAFVLEPLKVVLMSLFVAIVVRDAEKDMESDAIDVQPLVEANEQLKEVKFRPLAGFALIQAQDEGRRLHRLSLMLRQTIAYVMLTAVLLAVSHVYFGSALYRSAGHIENNFVYTDDIANGSPAFYNISSQEMFWSWAQDVLTPALYKYQLVTDEENPVLLGPARFRQIRSLLDDCVTRKVEGGRQCVGRLDFTEDTHAYSTGWNSTSGNASWVYSSASQLKMRPKFGQSLLYEGGGYIQELGTTYNQTLSILQQLSASEWLDRRSRALFMEFTVYSAASDLFSCITLLLEFPISGGVLASHSINTQRLYISSSGSVDPLYICQVLLLIPAVYLLIHVALTISRQRTDFVHHPGIWLELIIVVLTLTCIGMYVACVVVATDIFEEFTSSSSTFANFERAANQHSVLRNLHATLLFFIFIKIAGQVRFIRPLSVYIRTLGAACSKLTGATLIFLILLLTYAQIGYLFYGTFVSGYRSFQNTLFTLLGVVRGGEDLSEALEFQPIFSYFFFTSFYAFVYGLFVALVIAILQDAYKLTRSQMYFKSSLEPQDYEMIEFMLKRLKLWMGNTKPKPAFRRVKFEGLPSLPSRGSSSTASSWRPTSHRSTPTPDLIPSSSNTDALDALLPRWEKLLSLLGTVELIEKEEQRQVKRVETAMDWWNSSRKPPQKKRPHLKKNAGPTGKPPVDPKSKFSRFRSNFQTSNAVGDQAAKPAAPAQQDKTDSTVSEETTKPAVPALAVKMGPPSISLASRPTAGQKVQDRPASDQGARATAAPARPASDSQKVRPSPAGASSGDSLPLASGQCRGSDGQKVRPSPAGTSSGDSLPLASGQCRGSDGQKEHPAPSAGTAELLSAAASKTERPNSDTPKTRQSGAPPASDKLSNTKSQSLPQSKGPSTSGPGFPIKQPVKVHVKKTSTDDSKQAWDG